jgi:hypothetical protein
MHEVRGRRYRVRAELAGGYVTQPGSAGTRDARLCCPGEADGTLREPIWVSVLKPWGSAAALGGLASPKVLAAAKPIGSSRLPWHFRDMPQIAGVALFGASRHPRERGPLRTDGSARECQTTSSSWSP